MTSKLLELAQAKFERLEGAGAPAERQPSRKPKGMARRPTAATAEMPSEDDVALRFLDRHNEYRRVPPTSRWLRWDGKRWREDSTTSIYEAIRVLVRELVRGGKAERSTASAGFVAGVEKLLRSDQRITVLPEQLDADPWILNTQNGIVDLKTGVLSPHDPSRLCTRITAAAMDASQGAELWRDFISDITQGDAELAAYLQRVAGYFATGSTQEDVLVYIFGVGANAKSSFGEANVHVLGDYARVFAPEVLMESRGERHPTELAQFMGVRFALTSEPASRAVWNDSRVKSLTGDAVISARVMRGDPFEFQRTHKTMVLGNHAPRLEDVTHAIRRRVQMVPFRAVFQPTPGPSMRERLKAEAGGAILAWIVAGVQAWLREGTSPPQVVRDMTAEYLADQDMVGQWLQERCERDASASERSSDLHRDYSAWCERQGTPSKSIMAFSAQLVSAGIHKRATMVGKMFFGLRLRSP